MYLGELGVIYRLKVLKVKWFASRRQSDNNNNNNNNNNNSSRTKRYVCEWE